MKPSLPSLLRLGFTRGSRWRVLAIFTGLAFLPSVLALLPVWTYLSARLDHAPVAEAAVRGLDPSTFLELLRGLSEEGAGRSIGFGLAGALVMALVVAPWSAGAALAEARAPEPMRVRGLLAAAGDLYGRLLRMLLVAAIPMGLAFAVGGGISAAAAKAGTKALTEADAVASARWARMVVLALVFVAHLTVDAGKAHLAARPERRSAFLAWVAGAWMVLRRPLVSIAIGLAGTGAAVILALAAMAVRGHLPVGPGWSTFLGFLLATAATTAVAWGRSVRLAALSELAAFDAGERIRKRTLRAARLAAKVAPTEPMLPAVTPTPEEALPVPSTGVEGAPEPTPEQRPLDVTAPLRAPPKTGEG